MPQKKYSQKLTSTNSLYSLQEYTSFLTVVSDGYLPCQLEEITVTFGLALVA